MALSDRVKKTQDGFQLMRSEDENRRAFYGLFSLRDDPKAVPEVWSLSFWDAQYGREQIIEKMDSYVYVEEKVGDDLVESYRFYFTRAQNKESLNCTIENIPWYKRYGAGACRITFAWGGGQESIHRSHVALMDAAGNRYPFITEFIGRDGSGSDEFIFHAREGETAESFQVVFSDLLKQKYIITQ